MRPGRTEIAVTVAAALITAFVVSAHAQSIAPQPTQWTVAPSFAKSADARENISGAACAVTQPAFRSCLAVNDQKKYAQFFSIFGNTIVPGSVVRLLGDGADGDPDAEGAAYHNGYFYVVGSHGRGRHSGKLGAASFLVFRFAAIMQSGNAAADEIAPAVQTSAKLREVIRTAEPLGPFAEKLLNANGANIEGIAVDGERLYVGFRGPSLEGRAFILSAALDGVFGGKSLAAEGAPAGAWSGPRHSRSCARRWRAAGAGRPGRGGERARVGVPVEPGLRRAQKARRPRRHPGRGQGRNPARARADAATI